MTEVHVVTEGLDMNRLPSSNFPLTSVQRCVNALILLPTDTNHDKPTWNSLRSRRRAAVTGVVTSDIVGLARRHRVDPGVIDEAHDHREDDVLLRRRRRRLG